MVVLLDERLASARIQFVQTVIGSAAVPLPTLIRNRVPSIDGWYCPPRARTVNRGVGTPVRIPPSVRTLTAISRPSTTELPNGLVEATAR